jgi:hypothetical protein
MKAMQVALDIASADMVMVKTWHASSGSWRMTGSQTPPTRTVEYAMLKAAAQKNALA